MEIILKIKDNLYKESEDGKIRKLIKKNVITNLNVDTNDILTISDCLNNKGNVIKNYCRIHLREVGPVIVNHSREQISKLKQSRYNHNQIGFKQKFK